MSKARIYYHDIGDYLSREEKLAIISKLGSVENIDWQELTPNEHGDWLNQRNDAFEGFIPLAPEKKFDVLAESMFITYATGLMSARDAWVYNFSKQEVALNMQRMIGFYNKQLKDYQAAKAINPNLQVEDFIDTDAIKISWTRALRNDLKNGVAHHYSEDSFRKGQYRPFCKQQLYYAEEFIESPGLSRKLFPYSGVENKVICVSGVGSKKDFSLLITNDIPDYQSQFNTQYFAMYHYEERKAENMTLFDDAEDTVKNNFVRRDAISDFILERCRKAYGSRVSKEDLFYYVYGILHSVEYRTAFAADLKKMLPRIPLVDEARDFYSFSKAGRALAELHLDYEALSPAAGVLVTYNTIPQSEIEKAMQSGDMKTIDYQVTKMRFPSKSDKSKIHYNHQITIENIPAEAYDYVVNGKSAIEWIMERYAITTHKDSGITNDPNLWASEHNNPRYILNLLLSVIRLSLESVEIVNNLPKITF